MAMEYRNLGKSGLKVSTLCFGAMTFGEPSQGSMMNGIATATETVFELLAQALEAGVNFIDTADVYGNDGLSERVLGQWFEETGRRDEVVLASKFRFRMKPDVNGTGASRRRIIEACEASLERLKTDYIDLYQIHMQDIETPVEETARALDDLVRSGKVRYIGCSNYAAYRMVDSLWTSRHLGLERFVALQAQYNLIERTIEREHTPVCEQFGLGILPWSPLAGGFLTGKYTKDGDPPAGTRYDKFKERLNSFDSESNWRVLDAVNAVAAEHEGASAAQVSLAWLLRKPAVTSVIFGARNASQLEDNLKAAEMELTDADMKKLDDASAVDFGYPYDFIKRVQGRW